MVIVPVAFYLCSVCKVIANNFELAIDVLKYWGQKNYVVKSARTRTSPI